jgi:hypothetical protein
LITTLSRFFGAKNEELQRFKDLIKKVLYWIAGKFIIGDCIPSLPWAARYQDHHAEVED